MQNLDATPDQALNFKKFCYISFVFNALGIRHVVCIWNLPKNLRAQ